MKNKKMLVILAAFFIGISGVMYSFKDSKDTSGIKVTCEDNTETVFPSENEDVNKSSQPVEKESEQSDMDGELCVYVCGEVKSPGVYLLKDGKRISDAILAAGGMTDDASSDYLNQALKITDGQKIYVPSKQEVSDGLEVDDALGNTAGLESGNEPETQSEAESGKVNINTASKEELTTLSGIGETRAEAIIAYRQENGLFNSIEDIKNVSGIKDGLYQKICNSIVV